MSYQHIDLSEIGLSLIKKVLSLNFVDGKKYDWDERFNQ